MLLNERLTRIHSQKDPRLHFGESFTLTTIHSWAHKVPATHTKPGRVNDQQAALTTLKLRAHTCPDRLCQDTPTQSLKACDSPPGS